MRFFVSCPKQRVSSRRSGSGMEKTSAGMARGLMGASRFMPVRSSCGIISGEAELRSLELDRPDSSPGQGQSTAICTPAKRSRRTRSSSRPRIAELIARMIVIVIVR